jgi:hypothetical protein
MPEHSFPSTVKKKEQKQLKPQKALLLAEIHTGTIRDKLVY